MTLAASFVWKNPDSTRDLNRRLERVVQRGFVHGCGIAPAATGLFVNVDPGVAISFDGMTVVEDVQQTLPVAVNTNNYVCLYVKYNFGGSPATPTLEWRVMDETAYLGFGDKDFLIVVGRVDVPPAVSSVLDAYIWLDVRDEVTPLGRDWFRGNVATPAALPAPPPNMNKVGDFYFVASDNTFFFWNGTVWEPLNTGSYNAETSLANQQTIQSERDRVVNGSGVISGVRPNANGDFSSNTEVDIVETPSVADQIGIDSFTALVNGHFIETFGQYVAMDPKPGTPGATRYDIIYLEMWREDITVPETHGYERNPDGSFTYTMDEVQDKLNQLGWKAGVTAAPVADNFNLNPIEAHDHGWRVVKWQLGYQANLPSSVCLYNPSDPTISGFCLNVDGNAFTSQPAGTGTDDRIWVATSTTGVDGYSYAIPILIVNRTNDEDFTTNDAVQVFRDGERFVFPVYPIADTEHAARKALDTVYRNEPTPLGIDHYPFDEPSGFLSGMDFQLNGQTTPNHLDLYEDQVHVRVRGIDDWITNAYAGPGVQIGSAPTVLGDWARTLVYLKMNVTLYDNSTSATTRNQVVSVKHTPYIPSSLTGNVRGQGWKRGYVTWEFVAENLGSISYLDEYDAMTASGWTRGDLSMASHNTQYEDGGIWSRSIPIDADNRIHPYLMEWAIPVALIHRRNSQPWNYSSNPNGSSGRPDGHTDPTLVYLDDLVDLRHRVDLDESSYQQVLDESIDAALKGRLHTRLGERYLSAATPAVAGSRLLQTDYIGAGGPAFSLSPPDGIRKIWSDAKEFQTVAFELDLNTSSSGALYTYVVAGNIGTLTIKSPTGAHLVRHIPGCLYANGDTTLPNNDYLDFLGPPCWATPGTPEKVAPSPATLTHYNTATFASNGLVPFFPYNTPGTSAPSPIFGQPFKVVPGSVDGQHNATEMTGYVDLSSPLGTAIVSYWVHYNRTFTGAYAANYGLGEIPDEVHRVTFDPGGTNEALHVGPIYTTVNKSVTAATTLTFTAADVTAATSTPGTVTLRGVDLQSLRAEPEISSILTRVTLNDPAMDTITLHFSAPYTGEVSAEVFYESDVSRWVEVGRGGKSVQALFSWGTKAIDFGSTPPGVSDYVFGLGTSTWTPVSTGYNVCSTKLAPFIWSRGATPGDWELVGVGGAAPYLTTPYSNMVSLKVLLPILSQYTMVVWANHEPLAIGDKIQIDYTYTPYQGVSSNGGAVAAMPQAVTTLKDLLHGTIEANTDFCATQSGPTSFFSGVNAFSGLPANNGVLTSDLRSASGSDRMSVYNRTELVRPDPPFGTPVSPKSLSKEAKFSLNAAAVLRLPFPLNSAMVTASTQLSDYHSAVMEFDLDPIRAGSGAGFLTFAPGYPNSGVARDPITYPIQGHQYVNGLTPLRIPGSMDSEDKSSFASPDHYGSGAATDTFDNVAGSYIESDSLGDRVILWVGPDHTGPGDTLLRTLTPMESDQPCAGAIDGSTHTSYAGILCYDQLDKDFLDYSSIASFDNAARYIVDDHTSVLSNQAYWTAITPFVAGSPEEYVLCITPATTFAYHRSQLSNAVAPVPILRLDNNPDTVRTKFYGTEFTASTNNNYLTNNQLTPILRKTTDLIRLPFGSFQTNPTELAPSTNNTSATCAYTLTGRRVEYPADWSVATISKLEGLFTPSNNGKGAGRGLYLGTTEKRYTMPMLVPGSGTHLDELLEKMSVVVDQDVSQPDSFPYMPSGSLFDQSNITYAPGDIGGPIAYVFYGTLIRPSSNANKNKMVLQITGGPTGGVSASLPVSQYTPEDLDGSAIDAFWPIGRPIFKSKK